jgi:hypothetical protein
MSSSISSVTTSVATYTPAATSRNIRSIANVHVGTDHIFTVNGTTDVTTDTSDPKVCCTLIRHGRGDTGEKFESILTEVRFGKKGATTTATAPWSVTFRVIYQGIYLVTCHSRTKQGDYMDNNDYVEVRVTNVDKPKDGKKDPKAKVACEIDSANFKANSITANGTVLNAFTPLMATLSPITCADGTESPSTTPTAGLNKGVQMPGSTSTSTAYSVVINYDSTGINWNLTITPSSGTFSSGCYLLQVTAAGEGTASVSGTI